MGPKAYLASEASLKIGSYSSPGCFALHWADLLMGPKAFLASKASLEMAALPYTELLCPSLGCFALHRVLFPYPIFIQAMPGNPASIL